MARNRVAVGQESPTEESTGSGVGNETPVERLLNDADGSGPTLETSGVSPERRFAEVRRLGSDDQDAVFDHFDVETPADVMAADDDPPAAARSRREPLVVGAERFDPDAVLLEDRTEGEAFNWVAADDSAGSTAGNGPDATADTATDSVGRGGATGPVGRLLARVSALF